MRGRSGRWEPPFPPHPQPMLRWTRLVLRGPHSGPGSPPGLLNDCGMWMYNSQSGAANKKLARRSTVTVLCTVLARKRSGGNVVGNGRLISKHQLSSAGDGAMRASSRMVLNAGGLPVALSCFFCHSKDSNAQCITNLVFGRGEMAGAGVLMLAGLWGMATCLDFGRGIGWDGRMRGPVLRAIITRVWWRGLSQGRRRTYVM